MSEITILHLSDIHFKKKEKEDNKTFSQTVQQRLIDSVKNHSQKKGSPDVVVVTGDIAFSGKKHEYEEAAEFFDQLKGVLPDRTEFLAVPGNHDVDREKIRKSLSLHDTVQKGEIDGFLENKKERVFFVNPKFHGFRVFMDKLHPHLYSTKKDYFWVKDIKDKGILFLGLNSAWASEGDHDRFNIALGYQQVLDALDKLKSFPNRIVLMHHPLFDWLEEKDMAKCRGEIFDRCGLILHGHVHIDRADCISTPSNSCICLGANASYTHDESIGFQFIRVHFREDQTGVSVRVWPYILDKRERPLFYPDTRRWRGQKGRTYFDLETRQHCGVEEEDILRPLHIPAQYRDWVMQFHSRMDTQQLDPNARAFQVPLPELYIPIETVNPFHKPTAEDEGLLKKKGKKMEMLTRKEEDDEAEEGKDKEPAFIDIEELMGCKECILLRGPAGMGKTTLIKHLSYTITQGGGPVSLCGYLPVVVFLKDLWPLYEKELSENNPGTGINFLFLLNIYLQTRVDTLEPEVVGHFLSRHRALFLIDGLDEVPEHFRPGLVELIAAFRVKYKKNRFLLTGRSHGIDAVTKAHFGQYLQDIEPLDKKKIDEFIHKWFRVVTGQAVGLAKVTAAEMIGDVEVNEHVKIFTRNPLLLTAVCILYLDNKRLPDQRVELYRRIVDNLIYRRFQHLKDSEKVRIEDYLKLLAFRMQERNLKSMDVGEAKNILKEIFTLESDESTGEYNKRIQLMFEEIEPRCGLLKRRGEGEIEFFHLSFQEFLAARHMFYAEINYKTFLENSWWEETLLLYAGLINQEWKDKANQLVKEILEYPHKDEQQLRRLRLMGCKALRDIQEYKRNTEVLNQAREKLLPIIEPGTGASLEERFDAGEILGALEDPRIIVPGPPMIEIPAGEFTRGSDDDDSYDDEKPVQRIYLDAFEIGTYPVTNHEFKAFVDDRGYDNQELWTPEGWQWQKEKNISEPGFWHDRKWNGPNFPVVGVSWYEAFAYAAWLSRKTGDSYCLPTEAQWEKAARGSGGFLYPWGNTWQEERCNSYECGLGRTSPVGIFPAGESPYGCLDMAGNVLEWCVDWGEGDYYKKSSIKNPQGPENGSNRVFRGGCWFYRRRDCRAPCRSWAPPGFRVYSVGFRLVRLL